MHDFRSLCVCSIKECGSDIHQADLFITYTSRFYLVSPHHNERLSCTRIIERSFSTWKRHTIIAGNDNKCIIEFTCFLHYLNGFLKFIVHTFHCKVIIGKVSTCFCIIRKEFRNFKFIRVNTIHFTPAFWIWAVRVFTSIPIAERLVFRLCLLYMLLEVRTIITGRVISPCSFFINTRSPALLSITHFVAVFLKNPSVCLYIFWETTP